LAKGSIEVCGLGCDILDYTGAATGVGLAFTGTGFCPSLLNTFTKSGAAAPSPNPPTFADLSGAFIKLSSSFLGAATTDV